MSKEIEKKLPVGQPRIVMPLPCPFCGEVAELKRYQHDHARVYYGCSMPRCAYTYADEADALAAWNRREKPKRQLICGWRGMAGGEGCILPLGHSGGHGFSDGSGSGHNANVDLPDTAAQDSASKTNNPAVSG
jgi:hypothetical protein